jgi:hypothetical protein
MKKPNFKKTDLSWIVDYDYERSACTCGPDDYICRCTTITNTWIENVNVREVVKHLYSIHDIFASDIDEYCFERICHAFKIYDKDLYEIEIGAGYYGEEVYGVWFENEEKVVDAYKELVALDTDIEKIKYCFMLEYGYLLDCVESATSATIIETDTGNIRSPQKEYFEHVYATVIEEYKNRDLPIAVCIREGDRYRLIDGYHRFVANKDREQVDIIALG